MRAETSRRYDSSSMRSSSSPLEACLGETGGEGDGEVALWSSCENNTTGNYYLDWRITREMRRVRGGSLPLHRYRQRWCSKAAAEPADNIEGQAGRQPMRTVALLVGNLARADEKRIFLFEFAQRRDVKHGWLLHKIGEIGFNSRVVSGAVCGCNIITPPLLPPRPRNVSPRIEHADEPCGHPLAPSEASFCVLMTRLRIQAWSSF